VSNAARHIPPEAVREELDRVLLSHEFRSSKRSQDFLRYVVGHALDGGADHLKERTIGMEVFGRPASYDPSEDATVRVKAGEVRKRLGLYYASEGARNPIRIDLPSGKYIPEFHWHNGAAPVEESPGIVHDHHSRAALFRRRPILLIFCMTIVVAVVSGLLYWTRSQRPGSALSLFWAPVIEGTTPISVCAAFVPVYALNREPSTERSPTAADFVQLTDQFVGGGDLLAVSRLSSLFTRLQRPYLVKVGDSVSFEDLRNSPTILVGYSYTHWKEISQSMRFFIDASRTPVGITDAGAPTRWVLPNLPPDRRTSEDYALVTRVFHPDTHAMLVELAGVTQYGTNAAAEFVTSSDLLGDALRAVSPDWPRRNLQFVLHVKVLSGIPTTPKVVATYVW
jgi:hypothetical protein